MMQTQTVRIAPLSLPEAKKAIEEAGRILREGGLVAFPTETVYGLGANGWDEEACARIYEAKGRPSDNPLILHIADRAMLDEIAEDIPLMAEQIIAALTPGPITLILKKSPRVPDRVTGALPTVGVRMPDHDVARALIRAAGCPIAAPSANLSGRPSPTTAETVRRDLAGRIPMILDGGPCTLGLESTIVDCTGEKATILRPGAVTRETLEELLGPVALAPAIADGSPDAPRAPGMKYAHYAPKIPMTLIEGKSHEMATAFLREIRRIRGEGCVVAALASNETIAAIDKEGLLPASLCFSYGQQGDLRGIAAGLYESLRHFDCVTADMLLAEGVSEEGIGLAIMNRMRKASAGRSIPAHEKT